MSAKHSLTAFSLNLVVLRTRQGARPLLVRIIAMFDQRNIELSNIYTEEDTDVVGLQIFSNPAYSQAPQTDRIEIVGPQPKRKNKKNTTAFDLKQLLALAELRYIEDTKLLLRGIAAGTKLQHLYMAMLLRLLYPRIKHSMRMLKMSHLYRWKCFAVDNQSTTISRARAKGTAVSLLRLAHRRNLQKAFIMFRESCTSTAFIREIWGDRDHKLARYIPPPKAKVTTVDQIKLVFPEEQPKDPEGLKLDPSSIREFKAALKQRYKIEDAALRRPKAL
mmetsp:Transcript_17429/g.31466  ORF Transcript_17429/g.31466 Transcript_17429/m.31466 type:complete len:276 (-) Transcript_17429:7861-8688(-)